jgi:hypothetical protein
MTCLAQITSTGEIIAAQVSISAWLMRMRRTARLPNAWPTPARRRASQLSPASA